MTTSEISLNAVVPTRGTWIRRVATNNTFWIFAIDIVLIIFFFLISINHTFLSGQNIQNLMLDSGEALLLGIAIAFLLGAGEFDISLGANLILSSVVSGEVAIWLDPLGLGYAIAGAIIAAILTGIIVGFINGLIVTRLNVNSLIATLAMLGIVTGIAFIVSGGADITGIPASMQDDFGLKTVVGIPLPFLVAIVAWAVALVALRYTRFGLHILAMGSSRAAADRAGVKTSSKLVALFMVAGGLAGISGFIDITRFAATNIAGHTQDSLSAITAAVIGGTALAGGVVSMVGLLGGVVLAVILANGLVVIGVSSYYQLIAVGVILVIAVSVDQLRRKDKSVRLFTKR